MIRGNGPNDARLMVVGDYARKQDSQTQNCLSGYYSKKLNEFLRPIGIAAEHCYLTCVVKDYITGLGVGAWGQDKKILETYWLDSEIKEHEFLNILISEINDIQPTTVLAMGEYSLRVLTGKSGIAKWRGSVLPLAAEIAGRITVPNLRIVATQHVSLLQTQEQQQYIMRLDFAKVAALLDNPNKRVDAHSITIARNSGDVLRFIEYNKPAGTSRMTYDIETRAGFITCAGISYDGEAGMCIPLWGARDIDPYERCRMLRILASELEDPAVLVGNQNIEYDHHVSERYGLKLEPVVWDTMLATHTIASEFPKNLGFLTSIYTDMSFYKDEGREFDPRKHNIDQYYSYNAKDAISTWQIWQAQEKELADMDLLGFFNDFVMRLYGMYHEMAAVGILQSLDKKLELVEKYEGLRYVKNLELTQLAGKELNLNAHAQIGKWMEENKLPVIRHRVPSGFMAVNTDAESIRKMLGENPASYNKASLPYDKCIRFLNLLMLIRRIDKIIEHINVGAHPDGRIHTSFKLAGTTSGRTAGSQTPDQVLVWEPSKKKNTPPSLEWSSLGQSFQVITKHGFIIEGEDDGDIEEGIIGKDVREMYIPDTGMVLVEVDLSQAEARVVDVLCEDWEGLAEYGKVDKHCKVASLIYPEIGYERLVKEKKTDEGAFRRQLGKKSKHATNYDMEDYRFSCLANITRQMAREILFKVHKGYPRVRQVFHRQVEETVRSTRQLLSPSGRKRTFFHKLDNHQIKIAYSTIPQCTVSDHMKAAMLRARPRLDKDKAWFIAENHDSVTALVDIPYLYDYCMILQEELIVPINFSKCSLPRDYDLIIPCEFSIGRENWGKMVEVKDLETLRVC